MNQISSEIIVNDQKITLETGKVARQANGAVMASCDGTTVLATVAAKEKQQKIKASFHLSVNYQEKLMQLGKFQVDSLKEKDVHRKGDAHLKIN